MAAKFAAALERTAKDEREEDAVLIEQSAEAPRDVARGNRRQHNGAGGGKPGREFVRDERGPRGPRPPRKGPPKGGPKGKPHRKGPRDQY